MKPTVYLESSVISYYTARMSRDLIVAAHQEITKEWFENWQDKYEIFISQLVLDEISKGDIEASKIRLNVAKKYSILAVNKEAIELGEHYLKELPLNEKDRADAYHMALATINGIDLLVTWNFAHMNNAVIKMALEKINYAKGMETPIICTPEELMEE